MDKFDYTSYLKNNPLHKEQLKDKLITESLEVSEEAPSTKMKISEFKAKIKEEILSIVNEEEIDEMDEVSWNEKNNPTRSNAVPLRDPKKVGQSTSDYAVRVNEQEEDEVEVEDSIDIEDEAPVDAAPAAAAPEGLSDDEKNIQDALKIAYDNAIAIGDEKLADQIGNSITFFTRTHVVER
jgi:hypothetical protein|tara:strand:- start:601 stop:1143 length:543 start_codon:yes stop_codon:yes gene_type:complete